MCFRFGLPMIRSFFVPLHFGGLYRFSPYGASPYIFTNCAKSVAAPNAPSTASRYALSPSVVIWTLLERRLATSLMNASAQPAFRSPTSHEIISFEFASSAVHVHTSPNPNWPFKPSGTLSFLAYTNDQISSHSTRLLMRLRTC